MASHSNQPIGSSGFHRLLEQMQRSLLESHQQQGNLQDALQQYDTLSKELEDLSHHVSRRAIIPFSSKAFIPGRIINTNQVTAFIGAQHFALLSTQQAQALIQRRKAQVQSSLETIQRQTQFLTSHAAEVTDFADEFQSSASSETVDIREDYDEAAEEEWMRRHRENVKRERHEMPSIDVDEILSRNEAAELPQQRNDPSPTVDQPETASSSGILKKSLKQEKAKNRVTFPESEVVSTSQTIQFSHSSSPSPVVPLQHNERITSPAEVIALVAKAKSVASAETASSLDQPVAVAEHVVERIPVLGPSGDEGSSAVAKSKEASTERPLSRFKAARLRK